jgi:hypothetical protein
MFDSLRRRFGVPGVIAVIALVAALVTGGAYAASGGFTSKQKKEIEKIAKKVAGKPGAPGAPGANGTNGAAGAKGETGTNGTNGKSVTVTTINSGGSKCEGRAGAEVKQEGAGSGTAVCEGSPWTVGGTLPSKKSETGTWNISQLNIPVTTIERLGAVSFPIPLAAPVKAVYINAAETASEAEPEGCRWKEHATNPNSRPEATLPGILCVFTQLEVLEHASFFLLQSPGKGEAGKAGPTGVYLGYEVEGEPATPAVVDEDGVWAVTAP